MTRLLIVLACVAFFASCLVAMRLGWSHRGRRQAELPRPTAAPADVGPALLPPAGGLYVGSTSAEHWQDRVVAHGLGVRAAATATLTAAGLLIDRVGAEDVFIPAASIVGAGLGAGLAGKVIGPGGLLVVRWRVGNGPGELDTGLRFDDKSAYPDWVSAIDAIIGHATMGTT